MCRERSRCGVQNETKANLPRHFLKDYNAISEQKHRTEELGWSDLLLKDKIPYARLSLDNRVLPIVSNGLQLVILTAYVQPELVDDSKKRLHILWGPERSSSKLG